METEQTENGVRGNLLNYGVTKDAQEYTGIRGMIRFGTFYAYFDLVGFTDGRVAQKFAHRIHLGLLSGCRMATVGSVGIDGRRARSTCREKRVKSDLVISKNRRVKESNVYKPVGE